MSVIDRRKVDIVYERCQDNKHLIGSQQVRGTKSWIDIKIFKKTYQITAVSTYCSTLSCFLDTISSVLLSTLLWYCLGNLISFSVRCLLPSLKYTINHNVAKFQFTLDEESILVYFVDWIYYYFYWNWPYPFQNMFVWSKQIYVYEYSNVNLLLIKLILIQKFITLFYDFLLCIRDRRKCFADTINLKCRFALTLYLFYF